MAERRMFSKSLIHSAQFLKMPRSTRLLYYDLGMAADDDGIAEAYSVMRLSGGTKKDLEALESNGFIKLLDKNMVAYICDWKRNNLIKKDRYNPSAHRSLLEKAGIFTEPERNPSGTKAEPQVRLGKDRLGKDRLGEGMTGGGATDGASPPCPLPLTKLERDALVSEGISESYIEKRIDRATDYALAHKRPVASVLREWWANDRESYAESSSFETEDFFSAALEHSMKALGAGSAGGQIVG